MRDFFDKLKLLLHTSRPLFWLVPFVVFMYGFVVSGAEFSFLSALQAVFLTFPFGVFVYGINDVYDYPSDVKNPRKGGAEGKILAPKYHSFMKTSCLVVVLLMVLLSLLTLNWTNWVGMVLLLSFTYFYSAPPLRIKEIPPFDSFSNGFIYALGPFILGWSFGGSLATVPLTVYFVALCAVGLHALTTIIDYEPDKEAGDRTIAVLYGKRNAALFAVFIFAIVLYFIELSSPILWAYLIFAALVSVFLALFPTSKNAYYGCGAVFVGFFVSAAFYLLPKIFM